MRTAIDMLCNTGHQGIPDWDGGIISSCCFVACANFTGFLYTVVDTWGLLSGIGRDHQEM